MSPASTWMTQPPKGYHRRIANRQLSVSADWPGDARLVLPRSPSQFLPVVPAPCVATTPVSAPSRTGIPGHASSFAGNSPIVASGADLYDHPALSGCRIDWENKQRELNKHCTLAARTGTRVSRRGEPHMTMMPQPGKPDLRRTDLDPNFWYPLSLSHKLKKGKALAFTFAGDPIVVYPSESGKAIALEDRCAHRQFPLSRGVVCGEQIQCGYHAWKVRGYPCREAHGPVYVFPGDPERAEQVVFPALPLYATGDYKPMLFCRQVDGHYTFMHENLMDMNHQFLHRRLMGRIKPQLLRHACGDGWVEAQYHFDHQGGKKHGGVHLMNMGGEQDEKDYDVMTIRTVYPYQTLEVSGQDKSRPSLSLWAAYVPKDAAGRTCQSFGVLLIRKPKIPWLLNLAWPVLRHFTESVFTEDRMAVEAEQRAYDRQGGDWNQEVFPVLLDLRALLLQRGRPAAGPTTISARYAASGGAPLTAEPPS